MQRSSVIRGPQPELPIPGGLRSASFEGYWGSSGMTFLRNVHHPLEGGRARSAKPSPLAKHPPLSRASG
eukprot:915037-Pyramimonas_sp.AAC.1